MADYQKVYIIHNAGEGHQGVLAPPIVSQYIFSSAEIENMCHDDEMKALINEINDFVQEKTNNSPAQNVALSDSICTGEYGKAFLKISKNYEKFIPLTTNHLGRLDDRVRNLHPEVSWTNGMYNCMLEGIKGADNIVAVSNEYMKEIISNDAITDGLSKPIYESKATKVGIVNGINDDAFNPDKQHSDPKRQIAFLYSADIDKINSDILHFSTGKTKNKLYLQKTLGMQNLDCNFNNKNYGFRQYGYLNEDANSFLMLQASRFDVNQKGIDILIDTAKTFLEQNKNAQLIIGGPDYNPNEPILRKYINEVVNQYQGRAVLCCDYITNMNQFLAGADAVLLPSRWAPCELVQMQGMKMGAVPIVANTGGLKETIVDLNEDSVNAVGFKTKSSLQNNENSKKDWLDAMNKAYYVYTNDKTTWDKLIQNGMKKDNSWSNVADNYIKKIFRPSSYDENIKSLQNNVTSLSERLKRILG